MNEPVNPYSPPQTNEVLPAPARTALPGEVTLGARIAGGLLICNAVLALLERLVTSTSGPSGGISSGVTAIIFDFIIDFSLLQRNARWRTWAIIRAALGAVIYSALQIMGGQYILVVVQLMVSGSLLALLLGDAGKPRIAIACSVFGLYALLEIIGIFTG